MSEFLSEAWLAALDEAAHRAPRVDAAEPLVVQAFVTGGPSGAVTFHLDVGPAGTRVVAGPAAAPTVTIVTDHETATALHRGETNAQRALVAGRLEVSGDLAVLGRRSEVLGVLGDLFGTVRAQTVAETPGDSLPA